MNDPRPALSCTDLCGVNVSGVSSSKPEYFVGNVKEVGFKGLNMLFVQQRLVFYQVLLKRKRDSGNDKTFDVRCNLF